MRSLVCVCLVACGGAIPAVVTVAPLPSAPIGVSDAVTFGDCRIEGTGDRARNDGEEENAFDVFSTRRGRETMFVIAEPGEVHVAWSQFPAASQDDRARIEIGGQNHIRYTGFAALTGRTFSLTKRFAAEPGHMWARAGAPVEMIAYENGTAIARAFTELVSPKTIAVRGACSAVAYVPNEPEHTPDEDRIETIGSAVARDTMVDLHTGPSGKPFITIHLQPDDGMAFDVIERTHDFTRVRATTGDIEIDAWVPKAQLDEDAARGAHGYGLSGSSSCGGGSANRGTIAHDTPLLIGAKPKPLAGAFVEKDAEVYMDVSSEEAFEDHVYVPFTFVDRMIEAPNDSHLWVVKDAIQ